MNLRKASSACLAAVIIAASLCLLVPARVYGTTTISLSPISGSPGSRVALSGDGFIGKLATVYWDNKKLVQNIPVNKTGQINYTFKIPSASRGEHMIKVTDDSNWSNIMATATFEITPGITAEPYWGKPTNQITIFGYGFAPGEPNIKTTWDGQPLSRSPIAADKTGSWYSMLDVPNLPKGEYIISAYGDLTKANELQDLVFTVAPFCKAKPVSGPVGTKVLLTGVGFRAGEDGLTFTWDGPILDTNFVAQPNGSFSHEITVPPSVKGRHIIGIYGSSFTPKGIVPNIEFEVTPAIQLNTSSGNKGTEVKMEGNGFNASEMISISFDKTNIGDATTDSKGSFNAVFQVPSVTGKEHTVTASGNKGALAQTSFSTTKGTPATPQLLFPGPGAKIEAFNSVLDVMMSILKYIGGLFDFITGSGQKTNDSSLTTMNWTVNGDQTGVTYTIQLARTEDFSTVTFQKSGISGNSYILNKSSLPLTGVYYWRAKAADETGGESAWSNTWKFEIVPTSPLVLALSITILVLFIGIVFFGIMALINITKNRG